jgi:CheY-like chemotaxis protein
MVFQRSIKGFSTLALFATIIMAGSTLHASAVDNSIHEKDCSVTVGQRTVTLNIEPKPVKHMKELTFSVTVTPCDKLPDTLLLDLSMPGMQMGKNQVTLVKKSNCLYEGKGIIVRCMSGRTLWQATVLSDTLNNPAFTFNVRE